MAWWSLSSSVAAPLILAGSAMTARDDYDGAYSVETQTLSALARRGPLDWMMALGIAATALCLVITAAGLYFLRWPPRLVLAASGCFGFLIAARPLLSYETVHIAVTSIGAAGLAVWPALTVLHRPGAPRLCEPRYAFPVATVLIASLLWTGVELASGGAMLGLSERITAVGGLCWPAVVAFAAVLRSREPAMPPVTARERSRPERF